jgi:hypothetical protein
MEGITASPAGSLPRDLPTFPAGSMKRDSPGLAPAASAPGTRPFSMEGISGDMSDMGEASQAVSAVASGLNPLVPLISGVAGAAGAVAGIPWRKGAETGKKWMDAVSPYLSIPLPKTEAADTLATVPNAIMEGIKNYGTGKKLQFASKDSWALKWSDTSWGDQALAYTDSPLFSAAVDTLGEFDAFVTLANAAKGLKAKGEPFHPDTVDPLIAEAVSTAPKDVAQGEKVTVRGVEYEVRGIDEKGASLVGIGGDAGVAMQIPPGVKFKVESGESLRVPESAVKYDDLPMLSDDALTPEEARSVHPEAQVPDLKTADSDISAVKADIAQFEREADGLRKTGAEPRSNPELKFLNEKIRQSKASLDLLEERRAVLAEEPAQTEPPLRLLANESGQAKVLTDAAAGVLKVTGELEKVFSPAGVSEEAGLTAGTIRERNAAAALSKERIASRYEKAAESFEALSEADHLKFIDAVEHGQSTGYTAVDAVFADMRQVREQLWDRVRDLSGIDSFIENYFPHFWEDPDGAAKVFGTRPLAGPASFLKERTIPTVAEGYALGLKLKTTNPVRLEILKMHEMLRFIKGQEIFNEMLDRGSLKFVKFGDRFPDGFEKINDKIARVGFKGEYFAPTDVARVLNNYLSPGLVGKSAIFDGLRSVGNFMNQVQLGMSLFHMTFTTLDATIGRFSLGFQELLRGQAADGIKHIGTAAVPGWAPIETFIKGNRAMKGIIAADPEFAAKAKALVEGGGRVKMDSFYKNSSVEKFWDAWGEKRLLAAGAQAIPALFQTLAKPMMERWVPAMKLGMFMDMMESQNKLWTKHGVEPTIELRRKAYGLMVDAVDDRMGQMTYDNLFWYKTLKDAAMVLTRSLGWNIGTLRHILGGAKDILDIKADKTGINISARTAYLVGLPSIIAVYGAMYMYMRTGEGPKDLKDMYFPRTGKKTPDGRDERISLPSYVKDVYAYKEQTITTLGHKIHPLISMLIQMFEDKDYYGVMIRNPDDPIVKQLADVARNVAKNFVPFSVTGLMKRRESGATPGEQIEAFFGLMPAPKGLTQTPAEKLTDVVAAKHREGGPITREEFLHGQLKSDLMHGIANNTSDTADLINSAMEQGIQGGELLNIIRNSNKPHMTVALIKATPREAMQVWKVANPEERVELYPVIIRKLVSNKALTPEDRLMYMQQLQDGREQ